MAENRYPNYIMRKMRQNIGLKGDDISHDAKLNNIAPREAFDMCCNWEGIIGYAPQLLLMVSDCFHIDLDKAMEEQNNTDKK